MPTIIALFLLSLGVHLVLGISTLQFFSDKNCGTILGEVNATTEGNCHEGLRAGVGARLASLDSNCTATIYTDDRCNDNGTTLDVGICMSSDAVIGSFSIDCKVSNDRAAFTTAYGPAEPTATAAPNTFNQSKQSDTQSSSGNSLSPGIIGAIAAASAMTILMVSIICISLRCIRKRREQRHTRFSKTNSLSHLLSPMPCLSPLTGPEVSHGWDITVPSPTLTGEYVSRNNSPRANQTIEGNVSKTRGIAAQSFPQKGTLRKNRMPARHEPIRIGPPTNVTVGNSIPCQIPARNSTSAVAVIAEALAGSHADRKVMHRKTIPQDGFAAPNEPFMALTGRSKEIPMMLDTSSYAAESFALVSPLSPEAYMPWRRQSFRRVRPPTPPGVERRPSSEALPPWQPQQSKSSTSSQTSYAELDGSRSGQAMNSRRHFI